MNIDHALSLALTSVVGNSYALDLGISFFATYMPILIGIGFAVWLLLQKKRSYSRRLAPFITALTAALIARIGIVSPIWYFFPRERPFLAINANHLFTVAAPSFPSGHASFLFAFSAVVYGYNPKLGALFLGASALVCVARVAAGVHFPSDVIAGALIGSTVGYLTYRYLRKYLDPFC